ncbi:hypothetical protein MKEN_01341300 [Mycena kentingensis (nom. inval.)]|nr:hypothetical protein MKEN_01341300 [Mycena kentingensis (nom. inval.)]
MAPAPKTPSKPKKSVQFSTKNLLYSPVAWSPQLEPDVSSLPPSPISTHPTFPPTAEGLAGAGADVTREGGSSGSRSEDEPERMAPAPSYDSASAVVPSAPKAPTWTPPFVYTPWGATGTVELPPTPHMLPGGWPWNPNSPPSPSPPPLYTPWQPPTPGLAPQPPLPPPASAPASPIHLHVLLAFAPFSPPALSLDVAYPPHAQFGANQALSPTLFEPATHPPLPYLILRCRHLALALPRLAGTADDWSIPVVPFTQPNNGFVCVLDVLRAIYLTLRTSVHRAEYESIAGAPTRAEVDGAYFARCRAILDPLVRRAEELKGVKRVDVLCGKTRFLGLSGPLEAGPAVWELNLAE